MNKETQKNMTDRMKAIFELDLEPIKSKLMDGDDGAGWNREQADRCELEYKRFLALAARFPGEEIVPSVEVDQFWHMHILDTRKYAQDCERALGFFMHHTPHYGPRLAADAQKVNAAFARTQAMEAQLFEVEAAGSPAWCARAEDPTGKQAAWCARADEQTGKQAAWCARADEQTGKQAAWCARAGEQTVKQAAWCARAEEPTSKQAAWCARAEEQTSKQAAWCARAEEQTGKQAAWCARAEEPAGKQAAWCARAEDKSEKRAAWCAVAEEEALLKARAAAFSQAALPA